MNDSVLGQPGAERPGGQRGAVVGAECQLAGPDLPRLGCGVDDGGGPATFKSPGPVSCGIWT